MVPSANEWASPSGVSIVTSLERSKKKRREFHRKDGSRPMVPEDRNREVTTPVVDSMSVAEFREVRTDDRDVVMGS